MRNIIISAADGPDQRVDNLVLHLIGKIAPGHRPRKLSPPILDFLVFGQNIGDERQQANIAVEPVRECPGRGLAAHAVGIRHHVEYFTGRELLLIHLEADGRHGFVEQPVPCTAAGHGFFLQ